MKITLEQIAPYLPHKVGYINTATKKTGIVNTTNLHLFFMNNDLKIVLKPLDPNEINLLGLSPHFMMNCKVPKVLMDVDFYQCEIVSATWQDFQILLSHRYDISNLTGQGVAVAINTTI